MNIITEYPLWWAIFCLVAGILLSFILYYKESRIDGLSNWLKAILAVLRALSVAILSFFLLGPLLKTVDKKVEQPIIVFAQDNSESLIFGKDSSYYSSNYLQDIDLFKKKLEDKYDLRMYQFDTETNEDYHPDFSGKKTNISQLLDQVYNKYSNRNIGAIVLASDGIYNEGANPVYNASKLNTPIYTIALGDTSVHKDLILDNVAHNRLTYLGNDFPMEVIVRANKLASQKSNLTVRHNGNIVFKQTVDISDDRFTSSFQISLPADQAGIQKYLVALSPVDGEQSLANNYKTVFIEVLDSKQNVLVLADQIHPDISAIRQSLEKSKNYEVTVKLAKNFSGEIKDYSLIVLHQLPSNKKMLADLINKAKEQHKSLWYIVGAQSNIKNLNLLSTGVNIRAKKQSLNASGGEMNQDFSLFKINPDLVELIPKFPPLNTPFGEYTTANSAEILLKQKIGVVSTDYPLMIFNEVNGSKNAVMLGEGLWRWRLFDYLENDSHDLFDELILKTVQYLSTREDKSFFRVYNETRFDEGDHVYIEAELYNKSYELVNDSDVGIVLRDSEGAEFTYSFSKKNGSYFLDLNGLESGEYSYVAKTSYGGDLYERKGSFSINEVVVEQLRTTADHKLLYSLSKNTGAEMYYPQQLDELASDILSKKEIAPILYTNKKLSDWINLKWIFFLVLALLSIEWFIRKYKGSY